VTQFQYPNRDSHQSESLVSQRARIGAYALHAQYDSAWLTAPARAAFFAKFERQVDPEGLLPPAERTRRAESAMKQHMTSMAYASAKARRRRADGGSSHGGGSE
jgi:hypothetical protein